MPRVNIYIDGQNFSIECRKLFNGYVEYKAFARMIAQRTHHTLGAVRFYDSPSSNPLTQRGQQRFWDDLEKKNIKVCLGRRESNYDGTHREKECDVMLTTDLLWDGFCRRYDRAVLVSGDTDFAYAIEIIQKEMCHEVGWVYLPSQAHLRRLQQIIPEERRILLDEKTFRTIRNYTRI